MIAEVLLIKDENRYLLEHLAYNAAAGIDHFFIYDNMSRVPSPTFCAKMPVIFSTFAPCRGIIPIIISNLIAMQIF